MTYFDPEIYNKYNLSPNDRAQIGLYENIINNALENARSEYAYISKNEKNPLEVSIAQKQLEAIKMVEDNLAANLQDVVVAFIESYDEEEFEKYQAAGRKEREKNKLKESQASEEHDER